jgi:uncharacterized membrane protein YidH (DUF202 family)
MLPKKSTGKLLIVVGFISIVLGIIFTLQSKSVVGPSSSFMYSNPIWTFNGYIIITISIAALLSGIIIWKVFLE